MPAKFLWTGEARALYEKMSSQSSYAAQRRNAAAELVLHNKYGRVLLVGAGPDPSTEIEVISAMRGSPILFVHDVTEASANEALEIIRARGLRNTGGVYARDLVEDRDTTSWPAVDLATWLGYSVGNLLDEEAARSLAGLRRKASAGSGATELLIDMPVASEEDPRFKGGGAWAPTEEGLWLQAAYVAWRGKPTVFKTTTQWLPGGYAAVVQSSDGEEIIRYRRRTIPSWISVLHFAGWTVDRLSVAPGPCPRMTVLARRDPDTTSFPV